LEVFKLSNVYVKKYCQELHELVMCKFKFYDFEHAVILARELIKPLYYRVQNELECENQTNHTYDIISYHQMQSKLLNKLFEFQNFSDEDWFEWITNKHHRKVKPYLQQVI